MTKLSRRRTAGRHAGMVLAILLLVVGIGAQARAATVAQQLGSMPVLQPFNGEAGSTSAFSANWSAFHWANGMGLDTTTGWRPNPAYPTVDAAFYRAATYTSAAGGAAAAVTMAVNPGNVSRFLSLWLDASDELGGARAGYELRFTVTATNVYTVSLSKWQAGLETVLASQAGVSFVNGNALALVDQGGVVSAWTNTGSGFAQLLSASDATYSQGSVGLGGAGNITKLTAFKAAQLSPAAPTLTATSPASPSSDRAPFILGSAAAGTTVKLFANATCTGTPVVTGTAAALAAPGIQVSVADNSTTSFSATATDNLSNVSDCSRAISYTVRSATSGIGAALGRLTLLDAFATAENPVSGGGRWTKLSAASHAGQVSGSGTTGGWGPYNAFPAAHGAFWNPTSFSDAGAGVAVAATLSVSPSASERYFSLWLDMPTPGSAQTGYELRFTNVDNVNRYDVTLSKWQAGTRTVLARATGYTFAPQSSFALVDKGGTVSAWTDSGSGYAQLVSAGDASFASGYAGIEGAGNITRVRQFRAGALPSEAGAMLASLPSVDAFSMPENPLSGRGAWTKLSAASHAGQVTGGGTSGGWGPYNAFPAAHGAFWNQERFTDGGEGAAAAATLSVSPSASERYFSLWLDMPEPERAQTGYELRFTNGATANLYDVTLTKWQAGTRTVLARATGYTFAPQSSFALLDRGGTVSAWTDTGSGYAQLLSAADATFTEGYAGIEGAGNITRVRQFKAGDSTLGYAGVKHIGEAEAQYHPETETFTYTPGPGAGTMTGHFDPVESPAGGVSLPYTSDAVTCATSGHRIKVVYSTAAYPGTAPAEIQTAIRSAIGRMNAKVVSESRRSSGNARALTMRMDCDANGVVNVYNLSVGSDTPEAIRDAAKTAFGNPSGAESVKYLVFRDAPNFQTSSGRLAAGLAYLREEEARKTGADDATGNKNRIETSAAIIYRGSLSYSNWQTHATLHELFHTMGAVLTPRGDFAPFATSGNHCTDGLDVMCYDDGSPERYTETRCPATEYYAEALAVPLDCGNDTYFNASPSAGGWLSTHWNTGGSENPFLVERPAEIPVGGADTATFITLREASDGPPGSASVYGHVNTTNAGGNLVSNAFVNVNFQHFEGGEWVTKQIAHPTVTNSYYEVNNFGTLGVGRWRVRTVFPEQGAYHESLSDYKELSINPVPTETFLTLDRFQNGAPGTASVSGNVLHNRAPIGGTVNVNFQKLVNGTWTTMSTAVRTLSGGHYEVLNWGVGVGHWRVRAVFPDQDGWAQSESDYHEFDIQPISSETFLTVDRTANGTPGTASVSGNVLHNGSPVTGGTVNVNFQKLVNGTWTTMSTAVRTLAGGHYEVLNWGVGVGQWRVRAVFPEQGDYSASESAYHEFSIQPVSTESFLTVDQTLNGQPGYVSVSGNVLHNGAPVSGTVNINFQKWNGSSWQTMNTATPTLSNGHYDINFREAGVGFWRTRAVFPEQGDYSQSESNYHEFQIKSGYRLVARHSGKCLSLSANNGTNGTGIIQWDCSGAPSPGDGQVFTLVPVDDSGAYFYLKINSTGKCVDVTNVSTADGAWLQEWDCLGAGQTNQHWQVIPIAGQPPYEALIARHSGKCMDVLGVSQNNGARVGQWSCVWGGNQQWSWQAIE